MGLSVFVGVGNFGWEEYSSFGGEEVGISRTWATFHCLTFTVNLGSVMALVVAWVCHLACWCVSNEHMLRLKVWWKSTHLPPWIYLMLISLCCVTGYVFLLKVVPFPFSSYFTVRYFSGDGGLGMRSGVWWRMQRMRTNCKDNGKKDKLRKHRGILFRRKGLISTEDCELLLNCFSCV